MLPPEGAIAVNQLFKLYRFIQLTIVTGLRILTASHLHQLLIAPQFLKHLRVVFLIAEVFPKREADAPSDLLVMLGAEMMFVLDGAAEGMFHGVTIG